MSTKIKNRLLLTLSFFCLIGFAGQTFLLWKANDRLAQVIPKPAEPLTSIEQRILQQLDKKDADRAARMPLAYGTPFANAMPLQDFVDSFFSGFGMSSLPQRSQIPFGTFGSTQFAASVPDIAVDETEQEYRILIPVKPDQELELNTNIEDNSVSVSGVITEKSQQSQNNFSASSFSQRQFAKTVDLPTAVDEFGMTTRQTDAGIEITLPKKHS